MAGGRTVQSFIFFKNGFIKLEIQIVWRSDVSSSVFPEGFKVLGNVCKSSIHEHAKNPNLTSSFLHLMACWEPQK